MADKNVIARLEYEDYSYSKNETESIEVSVPEKLKTISISYDGGRFYLNMNGIEVYSNRCAGNDFSIDVTIGD